jgi:hypothetical protein
MHEKVSLILSYVNYDSFSRDLIEAMNISGMGLCYVQ